MKAKHTPTPWFVKNGFDKDGNGDYFPAIVFKREDSLPGGTMGIKSIPVNYSHDQEAITIQANAEFIVKSVNLHDELLEALKESKSLIERMSVALQAKPSQFKEYGIIEQALTRSQTGK
jgi:hypothetical protein